MKGPQSGVLCSVMTDLAHEVGQLVHGIGETLGLSLDRGIAPALVSPEPERRENCSHRSSSARPAPCSKVKVDS